MRVRIWQTLVLGLALGAMTLADNSLYAQGKKGGGGGSGGGGRSESFGGGGGGGGDRGRSESFGGSAKGGANIDVGPNLRSGANIQGGANAGGMGTGTQFRGNFSTGPRIESRERGNFFGGSQGNWNQWDRRYSNFYGRGWGYWPGYGWGINIPFGRWGGIGLGNYYGYYGYPYYGDPYAYYNDWGPGYGDYYGYDYSSPDYAYQQAPQQPVPDAEEQQGKLPPVPTTKELARFTDQQLQSFIAWAANGFSRELGQYDTGNTWVKYFHLDDLKGLAPHPPAGSAMAETSAAGAPQAANVLEDVLARMDSASKNDQYKAITGTWGFQALHVALNEAVKSPDERAPGVLKGQAEMLGKSLERLSNGDSWRKHLELDTLQKLASDNKLESNDDIKQLAAKFDKIAQNPEYQSIAQLPGFGGLYTTLHKVGEGRQPESTAKKLPSPPEKSTTE